MSYQDVLIPLEDELCDVVGKAMRGLDVGVEKLVRESGVTKTQFAAVLKNQADAEVLNRLARMLGLRLEGLLDLAARESIPALDLPRGLWQVNTEIFGMRVNAYLMKDPLSEQAVLFDSGGDAEPILQIVQEESLKLKALYLLRS